MSVHLSQAIFAPDFDEEKVAERIEEIVSQENELDLAGALDRDANLWHYSETPNLKRWCEVLELLDSTLVALLCKFEMELLVPVCASRINFDSDRYNDKYSPVKAEDKVGFQFSACDFRVRLGERGALKAARRVGPSVDSVGDCVYVITSILKWLVSLLRISVNRNVFSSIHLVLACLRAYDDEVAKLALEILGESVLEPYNHRGLCTYDGSTQLELLDTSYCDSLMDIVAASESPDLIRGSYSEEHVERILRNHSGYNIAVDTDLGSAVHRTPLEWQVDSQLSRHFHGVDLGAADFSLKQAMQGVLPPPPGHEKCGTDYGDDDESSVRALASMGAFVTEHAMVLLWRIRFQRLQALAGSQVRRGNSRGAKETLDRMLEMAFMAHTALIRGHADSAALNSFYLPKRHAVLDCCSVLEGGFKSMGVPLHLKPPSGASDGDLDAGAGPSRAGYWALCSAWAMLLRTEDVTPDADSEDSSPEKQEDVLECFQPVLVELGLGSTEEAPRGRGLPRLLIASCQYLLDRVPTAHSVPTLVAAPSSSSAFEAGEEEE